MISLYCKVKTIKALSLQLTGSPTGKRPWQWQRSFHQALLLLTCFKDSRRMEKKGGNKNTYHIAVQSLVPVPSAKSPLGKPKENNPTRTTGICWFLGWLARHTSLGNHLPSPKYCPSSSPVPWNLEEPAKVSHMTGNWRGEHWTRSQRQSLKPNLALVRSFL